jgi:HAD superfamily hydrolase (TIGR01509 family)
MNISNKTSIKAILFDINGVLLQTQDQQGDYLWASNIESDLGITNEQLYLLSACMTCNVLRGNQSIKDSLSHILSANNIQCSSHKLIQYYLKHDMNINANLIDFITTIDMPKYIITNSEPMHTARINQLIGHHFDGYFASYEIGYISPETAFMTHIENQLNLKPSEILLIDNQPSNAEAILNHGWNVINYNCNTNDSIDLLKAEIATAINSISQTVNEDFINKVAFPL